MKYKPNRKKEEFWREHIEKASLFKGSFKEYCRQQGISSSTMSYWRDKFRRNNPSDSTPRLTGQFIPVAVTTPPLQNHHHVELPNPKWVAEFILHLQERLQ